LIAVLNNNPLYHPRRSNRVSAREPCTIARFDGSLSHGLLLNLSNEGFCVECTRNLEPNERIEIRVLGLGRFRAIVRWSSFHRAGGLLEPFK
jgi:hypothetical protein